MEKPKEDRKANKNTNSTQVESQPRDMQHSYRQFDGYPQHETYVSTIPLPRVLDTTHHTKYQVSKYCMRGGGRLPYCSSLCFPRTAPPSWASRSCRPTRSLRRRSGAGHLGNTCDTNWIRIKSGQWIRIQIRNPDPDPGGRK
jgi:hypothetical protein